MAETLRDMVVSLSLNSDNFSANLRSINQQLKEADSQFKLAASGVTNFENTAAGAQAQLPQLRVLPFQDRSEQLRSGFRQQGEG